MAKRITKTKPRKASKKNTTARVKAPKTKGSGSPSREPRARRPAVAAFQSQRPPRLDVGIHANVPYLTYHDDPAPEPSLSASFIKTVEDTSPAHAWLTHPRLSGEVTKTKPSREMDFGSAAHVHLLGGQELHIINADDWKSPATRAIREKARDSGFAPVLKRDYAVIAAMKAKLLADIGATELAGVFDCKGGINEAVAIWKEDGFYFRARADRWIPPMALPKFPDGLVLDFKSTWESAKPERWSGTVFNIGSDFQSVLYPHGFVLAQNQTGKGAAEGQPLRLPAFRYLVQECSPPYEFSVFGPSQITVDHTTGKIVRAFDTIKGAWKMKKPPGYPRLTAFFDPPAWELKKEERAQHVALAVGGGR
jgi:hypothetical protein